MLLIALLPRLVVPGRFTPVRYLMNRQARFPNPQFILSCPVVGPVTYQLVWRPPAVSLNRSQTRWWHCHLTNPCPVDPASVTYSPSREVTSGHSRAQSP